MLDHREPADAPLEVQYGPSHRVRFVPGSEFERWAGATDAEVNSLHGQGIKRLAAGLRPLAYAPDGLVEAVAIAGASAFAYAVQWHPEWHCTENRFHAAIFAAFGASCRLRQQRNRGAFDERTESDDVQ